MFCKDICFEINKYLDYTTHKIWLMSCKHIILPWYPNQNGNAILYDEKFNNFYGILDYAIINNIKYIIPTKRITIPTSKLKHYRRIIFESSYNHLFLIWNIYVICIKHHSSMK